MAVMQQWAQCIRSHGMPNWPDPVINPVTSYPDFPHLPGEGFLYAFVPVGPAGRESPVPSVVANQDELAIACYANASRPMRGASRLGIPRMP